ncbi:polysaccharide biosynthesis tyrosine autokinase [soil metagenome]
MLEFLTLLSRRWRVVVVFVILGIAAAAVLTNQVKPSYRAQTQLFVAFASSDDTALSLTQGSLFTANRVKSYPDLVNSPLVLQPVIDELGLDVTPEQLAGKVSAEVPPNTVLIEVRADDPSPVRAAEIADSVATNLITVVEDLDRIRASDPSPVRVSITRPATAPSSPRTPIPALNIAIGFFAGLGLGLAAAAVREALDTTIKDEADVEEATGLPTLAAVPVNPDVDEAPVLTPATSAPVWSESYRKLRTNISYIDPDNPPRTLLVTSALAGDGKSITAANLAASLAQSGRRTILLEADLRRPTLSKLLGLVPDVGVTTVVAGRATATEVTQRFGEFDVITSGPIPPNPSELLGSQAFRQLVLKLRETYDNVVIDTPPLIAVTDAAVAAVAADVVILVTQASRTKKPELLKALYGLRAVDANVAGVVLNRVAGAQGSYYQYTSNRPTRTDKRRGRRSNQPS